MDNNEHSSSKQDEIHSRLSECGQTAILEETFIGMSASFLSEQSRGDH